MATYETIVDCIRKSPSERHENEIKFILPWFLNKAGQVFGKLKPEISKDILRNCEHSEKPRDSIIIRQGDKGDCFFVLLSGKVSIFINTEAVPDDPADAQILSETTDPDSLEEKKELDRSKYGKYIVSFDSGRSFGEIALLNEDCVRNASIIADEFCHLVVINRDLYNRSIRSVQEAELKEKRDFINNCDIFNNWMARYKRQAVMSLRKEQFSFDDAIVRQGEPLDGLYFVLKGQAKVVVDVIQHYTQYPHLHLHENPEEMQQKEALGKIMEQRIGLSKQFTGFNRWNTEDKAEMHKQKLWDKPLRRQGYVAAEQRQSQRHMEISLIGKGEMIGDVEHGMDLSTYAQSLICVQDTEVFILDAKNFERLVMNKRNIASSMEILTMKAESKLMTRVSRALDKQIPLIRTLCHKIVEAHNAELKRKEKSDKEFNYLSEIKNADTSNFIPTRGPIIDPYGPGTVFYRNKLKREQKMAKKSAPPVHKPAHSAAIAMFAAKEEHHDDQRSPRSSETERDEDKTFFTKKKVIEEFQDFETSSEHLTDLEKRMRHWFREVEKTKKGHYHAEVVRLNRFRREMDQKIHPGKKVYMRPKRHSVRIMEEEDDIGYKSEEEVFITAQSEIRSRLSSRQHSAFARSSYNPNNDGNYDEDEDEQETACRSQEELHHGRVPGTKNPVKKKRDPTAEFHVDPRSQVTGPTTGSARKVPPSPRYSSVTQTPIAKSRHQSSLPAIDPLNRLSAFTRVTNELPPSARDDPIGYSVQKHISSAEQRANTVAILKDILNNRLLPADVKRTLSELNEIHHSLPDMDEDTKILRLNTRNESVPMLRARSILLPAKSAVTGDCYRCKRHHMSVSTNI